MFFKFNLILVAMRHAKYESGKGTKKRGMTSGFEIGFSLLSFIYKFFLLMQKVLLFS